MSDSQKKKKTKKGKKNSKPEKVLEAALAGSSEPSGATPTGDTALAQGGEATPAGDKALAQGGEATPAGDKAPQGGEATSTGYEAVIFTAARPESHKYEESCLNGSGAYEIPSLPQAAGGGGGGGGAHDNEGNPAPSSGYMVIQSKSRVISDYECPNNNGRKISIRVKNFFARKDNDNTTQRRAREGDAESTDTGPKPHPPHYHGNLWSIILMCVCILVALISLVVSFASIGVSASKSCDCTSSLVGGGGPQAMMNCSITVATKCSFVSSSIDDNESESCETPMVSLTSEGSVGSVISLGCSVRPTPLNGILFSSTLYSSDDGGYFCRCYRDEIIINETTVQQNVLCNVISTQCVMQ